ncbi:hypothetical protein HALLA_08265 [Halostagnicola larsenii XH-48]|uniref:3-methyladenine DNA glycosylase n=1 Tax=Halostagnicola larsenii XH-48 TaxID=797299 RepID=W0JNX2_9EURY|nr:hypothetical protein [Halostagnicola larsenii]AHF98859.1 hypothetical protein HALLA_08265 [Halostagnicola larsenii XH-48]
MRTVEAVLQRRAESVPYEALADAFLEFDRFSGSNPLLLIAEAAASTTGQSFAGGIRPTVERFRESFVESGRLTSFAELASLALEDDDLVDALGARRKRHVLLEIADRLEDRPEDDDFDSLRAWAAQVDVYRYETDPIGRISGVGPSSLQYLRILAGVDTIKPDPTVAAFLESVAADLESSPLDASTPLRGIASCEWLAVHTSFRRLEIDRLAWWLGASDAERTAVADQHAL